jgi:hypothetical protein
MMQAIDTKNGANLDYYHLIQQRYTSPPKRRLVRVRVRVRVRLRFRIGFSVRCKVGE